MNVQPPPPGPLRPMGPDYHTSTQHREGPSTFRPQLVPAGGIRALRAGRIDSD